jgi:hypothetical protein
VRRRIDEADCETADSSARGVRITDLITGRIFSAPSLYAAERADRRSVTGAVDICAFSLIFDKLILNKRITQSKRPAQPSLGQTVPRQSANF